MGNVSIFLLPEVLHCKVVSSEEVIINMWGYVLDQRRLHSESYHTNTVGCMTVFLTWWPHCVCLDSAGWVLQWTHTNPGG